MVKSFAAGAGAVMLGSMLAGHDESPGKLVDGSYKEYEIGRKDHEEMLAAYRNREFEHAIFLCDTLTGEFDGQMNTYYEMWKDRCREMKMNNLPQDWDGTYVSTSK
jgi:hypothetical protein